MQNKSIPPLLEGDKWVSPADVATLLSVHVNTVRRMIKEGSLPAVKFSPRTTRVRLSDVYAIAAPVVPVEVER